MCQPRSVGRYYVGRLRFLDLQNRLTEVTRTEPAQQVTVTLTLRPGWNCVGLPFDMTVRTFAQILQPLVSGADYSRIVRCKIGPTPALPKSSGIGVRSRL